MSRAYRVKVRETLRQVIRAGDHVGTTLELLEILPREAMADLLREELAARGFREEGGAMVRDGDGVTVSVAPASGEVTVRAEGQREVELEATRQGTAYDDSPRGHRQKVEEGLRELLKGELEAQARHMQETVQKEVTDRLEAELLGLRAELDGVVNRVTSEALKRKAAQLGQIKEMTEDPQAGSLTIVLEV